MDTLQLVEQRLDEVSYDGGDGRRRISCKAALEIGEKYSVSAEIVGKLCDDKKIKITKCQLTCFE